MTSRQAQILLAIKRLLKEAYDHYFEFGDGGHKSNEGYIEIYYPNLFEDGNYLSNESNGLGIYSYALGPSRMHHFWQGKGKSDYADKYSDDPFKTALETVRDWHKEEMECGYSED